MKIRPVGSELFHAGGRPEVRTEIRKLIVAFCNFANAPKNVYVVHVVMYLVDLNGTIYNMSLYY